MILEMRGVGFPQNPRSNLRDVELVLAAGEAVVLFGHSGSGKGTLLKLAAGMVAPGAGTVAVHDPRPEPRLSRGFVFQKGGLLSNMTLLQNAVLPAVFHGILQREEALARARELFRELGIESDAGRLPALVGAEARILAQMARALLADPVLFILDDVFLPVNVAGDRLISGLISRVKREARAGVLVSSGELSPCLGWADRFVFLPRGGPPVVYRGREELARAKEPEVRDFLE